MVGWAICVEDFVGKDKATKIIFGAREAAEAKRDSLQKRYDDLEANRYKISVSAPISEIDLDQRIKVKFSLPEEISSELLLRIISEVDPLLLPGNIAEIDISNLQSMKDDIDQFNSASDYRPITYEIVCDHELIEVATAADPPGPPTKICMKCN